MSSNPETVHLDENDKVFINLLSDWNIMLQKVNVLDMKNQLVARILNEIADMLEMQGVEFKPRAYRRAARTIESLAEPIEQVYAQGKLLDLPGVGEAIAKKIGEIIESGTLRYYEELKQKTPVDLEGLLAVEGIGPKTVGLLYQKLGIKTLEDLQRAAQEHKIREIKGLGPKTEANILSGVELAKRARGRTLLGDALPIADEICERLRGVMQAGGEAVRVEFAGSLRRLKETIGDIDIVATTKTPSDLLDRFTRLSGVQKILERGETKSSILVNNLQVDLRVVAEGSFGSALTYFTGSKDHNIALRKLAVDQGFKLNEYGLFKGNKQVAGRTEEEIYKKLGLEYIPPELREDRGEVAAAMMHQLPNLIPFDGIRGDLQVHTQWSDGQQTIEEMAQAAKNLGYEYIAITDHYSKMPIVNGLNEERLRGQMKEIDRVNDKLGDIHVLKGAEVDIASDGTLSDRHMLKELDVVVASIHGTFRQTKKEMTRRLVSAMESGLVSIIGHPTGRKINEKNPTEMDFDQIFEASKRTKTYLEINASPERLDLSDANAALALRSGCKLAINTDAHNREQVKNIRFGIGVARRAWAEKKDVINTQPLAELKRTLMKT
jgi:DNA polymerase (family 10)